MGRTTVAEAAVPEIRFRPTAEVYAKAIQIADSLGLTVTDVARMALAQLANSREVKLVELQRQVGLHDMPVHGTTVGRIAGIASAAARAADQAQVQADRLLLVAAARSRPARSAEPTDGSRYW